MMPRENEGIIRFWPIFEERILSGWKTQSRRRGIRSYEVGQVLQAVNSETGETFANLKITKVSLQNYNEMTDEQGHKDGFQNKAEFWQTFQEIYPGISENEQFTAVEFEIVK